MQFIFAAGTYVPFISPPSHTFINFPFPPSLLRRSFTTHRLYFSCRSTSLLLVQLWLIQSKHRPFSYEIFQSLQNKAHSAECSISLSLSVMPPAPFPSVPLKKGCPLCGGINWVGLHGLPPLESPSSLSMRAPFGPKTGRPSQLHFLSL